MQALAFRTLLYRYFFFGWLYKDVSRGSMLERAALARSHNHRNGVMIHTHLDFTRQSISFLQAKGRPLYGPDGSHHTGAASGNQLAVG